MLREQIQALQEKIDAVDLEITTIEEGLKEKKNNLRILNTAKKKLEILEEQIGE